MTKKKLTIIGRGTAGALAVPHFKKFTDYEIDWIFDPNIKPQAVGEGSNLIMPHMLRMGLDFKHSHLEKIDGSFKHGIRKMNWKNNEDFFHHFAPPSVSYHFNATALQNYILSIMKDKVNIIEGNVESHDKLDSDYIFDCSGKPSNYDDYHMVDTIPVNSVYVTQCYWDVARFQYTLTIARPHGWVFGIPLANRCSIGYLYNNQISSLEDVKKDVENIFEQFNLTPSKDTNSFSFKNYYRKQNFDGRSAYGGNASFFLEPLEATSIHFMDITQRLAIDYWTSNDDEQKDMVNQIYLRDIRQIEAMIMLHYYADTIFESDFWSFAKSRSQNIIKGLEDDQKFKEIMKAAKNFNSADEYQKQELRKLGFGTWSPESFVENLSAFGLEEFMYKLGDYDDYQHQKYQIYTPTEWNRFNWRGV